MGTMIYAFWRKNKKKVESGEDDLASEENDDRPLTTDN
jgi:hypothetical protein